MIKIPTKLKIGAHTFKVEQKKLNYCGHTKYEDGIIAINKDMPQSIKESTLIHEILCHCLNTTIIQDGRKGELMHAVFDSLSEQLYQVLRENNLLK